MKKNTGNTVVRPQGRRKLPLTALVSIIIAALCIGMLFILYGVSNSGESPENPYVLMYIEDQRAFPYVSMRNSIHASGFNYALIDSGEAYADDGETFIIPTRFEDKKVVIMCVGKDSFKCMSDLNKASNVEGFILLNPTYPGNAAIEGFGTDNPSKEVAIFSFADNNASLLNMSDARMLFERLSGVDTIYGTPIKRGGAFASTVFISNNQKRYLSLSHWSSGEMLMLSSPVFQNELSGYLGITYGEGASYGRVNSWFVLEFLGILLSFACICLFLFFLPVPNGSGFDFEKKGSDSFAAIINLGMAIWFPVLVIAGSLIPKVSDYVKYIVYLSPILMLFLMMLTRLGFIIVNKTAFERRDKRILNVFIVAVAEILWLFATLLLLTNLSEKSADTNKMVVVLSVFLLDTICSAALCYADTKSRFSGQGGCSYYGNPIYFLEMLIPAVATLVFALLFSKDNLVVVATYGLFLVILPFILSLPIKRNSDSFEIAGLVHGITTAILMYIIL